MTPSPRRAAVEILTRIEREKAHAESLLDTALTPKETFNPQDRRLLTELVYGTLRMRGQLDWLIGQIYRGDPEKLDILVRNILRTALYQIRFTDRIPSFAAVNEAVRITKALHPGASGLVNAVLRNTLRRLDQLAWPSLEADPEQAIAVLHSHPRWLVRRLLAQYSPEETVAICRANNTIAPFTLRVNTLKVSREEALAALTAEGITAEPTAWSPDGLRLTSPATGFRETSAYRQGLIRIQDEASQWISRLLSPEPGAEVLDLCAGSGGKTLHLASLMKNQGRITAFDLHAEPLRELSQEAKRLGITIVQTQKGNGRSLPQEFSGRFDRVLLDAPCSGLGTLRHNPEIRWRLQPEDFKRCRELQIALLSSAVVCLKAGGRLVYSVCAVTPEENEFVISELRKRHPELTPAAPALADLPVPFRDGDFLKTYPHRHGADGFFAAIFTAPD
ncbi:MAG: 16S rRNA (cytosine(967)-C(5))-methyltransferase RsmB [Syntrophaceae bacterium]|nr:16S rRNA (cytosine(967)-C(5))-methyltransferase RsmB [Syntrophaceae bacterium]